MRTGDFELCVGSGKSSIGGAMLTDQGITYFNPDEAVVLILAANPK